MGCSYWTAEDSRNAGEIAKQSEERVELFSRADKIHSSKLLCSFLVDEIIFKLATINGTFTDKVRFRYPTLRLDGISAETLY